MAKQKKDNTAATSTSMSETRRRSTSSFQTKNGNTIVDKLRQQSPTPALKRLRSGSSKNSEMSQASLTQNSKSPHKNSTTEENTDINTVTLFQIDLNEEVDENESVDTENAENLQKDLPCTRVDMKITVRAHSNPEEQTVLTLQKLLRKLQSFDPKVQFAPWNDDHNTKPIAHYSEIVPRPSELEKFFPRIFFKEEGFTW